MRVNGFFVVYCNTRALLCVISVLLISHMTTQTMKALVFEKPGTAHEVLQLHQVPIPQPGPGEVRVKILASPINPADELFIGGKYRISPVLPQIAGLEGAGIIDRAGPGTNYQPGMLVAFRHKGLWAEYAVIPADKLIALPAGFPLAKASQLSLNPLTAYALLHEAGAHTDDWLLLTAGNSAVSKIIIQLARLQGIRTIALIRNDEETEILKQLGATEVLNTRSANLLQEILTITNSKGAAALLDAVGGPLLSALFNAMATNGQVISYGLMDPAPVTYHNSVLIFKNLTVKGFGIDAWLQRNPGQKQEAIDFLIKTIANDAFDMPVAASFALSNFKAAFEAHQLPSTKGKVLFSI